MDGEAVVRGNPYCEALGIEVPDLARTKDSPEANYYGLLIVALLERGRPITLAEAARRFETAGVAPAPRALASLKRCKPGRAPVYRDGDLYALDPHDDETALWAFRLGLKPPEAPFRGVVRSDAPPPPLPDSPLSAAHLEEAWRLGVPHDWSAQRLAICVLDVHGRPMPPSAVVSCVSKRGEHHRLTADSARYWRRGAPVRVRPDGLWELDPGHAAVRSAREAVRARIETARRWAHQRPDPAVIAANRKHIEGKRRAHREALARMRRALVHAFPAESPRALVLLDVDRREIATFLGGEIEAGVGKLSGYDIIAGVGVRGLLRALGFDPGERRLGELGPPQKTLALSPGRSLRITTARLIQGSCGISRPLGDPERLHGYLREGKLTPLRRRLESDAKSLFALYQYGRLHGTVRLRWGFLDERLVAPWVHRDEARLLHLLKQAHEAGRPLEVVTGSAPGWSDPWARVRLAFVVPDPSGWRSRLVDEDGNPIDEDDVQLARFPG